LSAGGSPAAGIFLLLAQKKGTKENEVSVQANLQVMPELKWHPIPPPLRGSLRCSPSRAAAELGRWPQTVLADFPGLAALLGGGKGELQKQKTKAKQNPPSGQSPDRPKQIKHAQRA
jgi:hypothetical protein